jgi:hypothetical protein
MDGRIWMAVFGHQYNERKWMAVFGHPSLFSPFSLERLQRVVTAIATTVVITTS